MDSGDAGAIPARAAKLHDRVVSNAPGRSKDRCFFPLVVGIIFEPLSHGRDGNGRRARLRNARAKAHVGSNPTGRIACDECRRDYMLSTPEVVGSNPTCSIRT